MDWARRDGYAHFIFSRAEQDRSWAEAYTTGFAPSRLKLKMERARQSRAQCQRTIRNARTTLYRHDMARTKEVQLCTWSIEIASICDMGRPLEELGKSGLQLQPHDEDPEYIEVVGRRSTIETMVAAFGGNDAGPHGGRGES